MGGFYLRLVGGIEVFQVNCRMFMGLHSSAALIAMYAENASMLGSRNAL